MKYWLINIVQGKYRCWDDFYTYGFISAGHDAPPSDSLGNINCGDYVFAYIQPKGIIGIGVVEGEAELARQCEIEGEFIAKDESGTFSKSKLEDIMLKRPYLLEDSNNPLIGEWIVKVKWISGSKKPKKLKELPKIELAAEEITDKTILKNIESIFGLNCV